MQVSAVTPAFTNAAFQSKQLKAFVDLIMEFQDPILCKLGGTEFIFLGLYYVFMRNSAFISVFQNPILLRRISIYFDL